MQLRLVLTCLSNTISEALISLSGIAEVLEIAQIIFQITVGCIVSLPVEP
jgi:hypothetical protein